MPKAPPFPKGNSLGGRPKGVKNKLAANVLRDLLQVWDEVAISREGANIALRIMSKEQPAKFTQLYASLCPREFWIEANVASEMSDVELDNIIEAMRERLLAQRQEQVVDVTPAPKALPNVIDN